MDPVAMAQLAKTPLDVKCGPNSSLSGSFAAGMQTSKTHLILHIKGVYLVHLNLPMASTLAVGGTGHVLVVKQAITSLYVKCGFSYWLVCQHGNGVETHKRLIFLSVKGGHWVKPKPPNSHHITCGPHKARCNGKPHLSSMMAGN